MRRTLMASSIQNALRYQSDYCQPKKSMTRTVTEYRFLSKSGHLVWVSRPEIGVLQLTDNVRRMTAAAESLLMQSAAMAYGRQSYHVYQATYTDNDFTEVSLPIYSKRSHSDSIYFPHLPVKWKYPKFKIGVTSVDNVLVVKPTPQLLYELDDIVTFELLLENGQWMSLDVKLDRETGAITASSDGVAKRATVYLDVYETNINSRDQLCHIRESSSVKPSMKEFWRTRNACR